MSVYVVRASIEIGVPVKAVDGTADRGGVGSIVMPYTSIIWIGRRNVNKKFAMVDLVVACRVE